MNKNVKIVLYGILVWLIVFIVSFVIFPIREDNRIFFESIMPVVLTVVVLEFSILYFKDLKKDFVREGILIGISWFGINIIIDLIMFIPESPMQKTPSDYMMDIGFTYLIILLVPIGISYLLSKRK